MGTVCACLEKDFQFSNILDSDTIRDHLRHHSPSFQPPEEIKESELSLSPKRTEDFSIVPRASISSDPFTGLPPLGSPNLSYEKIKTEDFEDMQGNFAQYIQENFGVFDNSRPLDDGVNVKSLPAVRMSDGSVYKGEWTDSNQKHGRASELYPDGTQFTGYYRENKRWGVGRLVQVNGNCYEGEFKDGSANGFGIYTHEDGSKYRGHFRDDKQEGEGTEEYPDSSVYTGQYRNGNKHGKGTFTWPDGKVYSGQFKDNEMEGYGEFYSPDGKKYRGQWVNGKMHGTGLFEWTDGKVYKGQYYLDKKHGEGKFMWPDGKWYKGQWRDGLQHGEGLLHVKSPCGEWEDKKGVWERGRHVLWL